MNQTRIGRFIAQHRRQAGLTQAALAEKLHVSDRAVSKWENGKCLPDPAALLELCDLLGVSADELLRGGKPFEENRDAMRLALLERALYRSSPASSQISPEAFHSAMTAMADAAAQLTPFKTRESAIAFLETQTGCSREECARAYDIYSQMGASQSR